MAHLIAPQKTRHRPNRSRRTQHSDFDGADGKIGYQVFENFGDDAGIDGFRAPDALGGLHRQRRQAGDSVTAMRRDCLDIGGDARSG